MSKYYASEMCNRVADTALQVLGGSGYMTDYPAERYLRDARITNIYEGTSQLQIVAAVRGVCSGAFEKRVLEFEEALTTAAVPAADSGAAATTATATASASSTTPAASLDTALVTELKQKLMEGRMHVLNAIAFVKAQSTEYMDLAGRRLVDAAAAVYIGHLLLQQALGIRVSTVGGTRMPTGAAAAASASAGGTDDSARLAAWRQRKARVARRFLALEMPKVAMNCGLIATGDRSALAEYELLAGPVPAKD